MRTECALCYRTVSELAEEELKETNYNRRSIKIALSDELAYPYLLCNTCEDLLRIVVPNILADLGIIKFDEAADGYILKLPETEKQTS